MPPFKIPHTLAVVAGGLSHGAMVLGAVALYWTGKIDASTFTAIMAGFGAFYTGVAGALVTAKQSGAVTLPASTTGAPSASAAPVAPVAGIKTDL